MHDNSNFWSHLSDSNQRPADYKSAALPAELKWPVYILHAFDFQRAKKNSPQKFGMAKVMENVNQQNFEKKIFC